MIGERPFIIMYPACSTNAISGIDLTNFTSRFMIGQMRVGLIVNCGKVIIVTIFVMQPPNNSKGRVASSISFKMVFSPKAHWYMISGLILSDTGVATIRASIVNAFSIVVCERCE